MDFLTLFFGWMSGLVGVNLLSQAGTIQKPNNVFLCDGRSIPDLTPLFSFIKIYEGWHPYGKDIEGRGKFTTGWGSMNLLRPDGSVIRPVYKGEVWTKEQADLQLKYYCERGSRILNQVLVTSGYSINNKLYYALLQTTYNFGYDYLNWTTCKTIISLCRGTLDLNLSAETYKLHQSNHYKRLSQYNFFGLGWSRRVLASFYLIKGIEKTKRQIELELKKAY